MQTRVRSRASTRVDTTPRSKFTGGLGGGVVTPDVYALARAAYLAHGNIPAVAAAAGISSSSAARLIDSGEPRIGLPSLRDVARRVAAELDAKATRSEKAAAGEQAANLAKTLEARTKAAKAAREHETKVLGDAAASRADEVRLVRANRQSALVLAGINADLLRVSSRLAKDLLDLDPARLSTKEKLGILRTVAAIVQRTAQASAASVNMERLLMGEPTTILGRADGGPSTADMSPEEAEQWLGIANRAFARRASRRTVIEAGRPDLALEGEAAVDELLEGLATS